MGDVMGDGYLEFLRRFTARLESRTGTHFTDGVPVAAYAKENAPHWWADVTRNPRDAEDCADLEMDAREP